MKIFPSKSKQTGDSGNSGDMKHPVANQHFGLKSILPQLMSPAMGLAVLGIAAFIFSFYRAGQLSSLVIPKDEMKDAKEKLSAFRNRPKLDINSQAIVDAADSSEATMLIIAGDHASAVSQAIKDLTDNPPDYLPTILEAGDILSQYGDDKELGFGLLERAVAMAPNNQYVTLRYCQRLISNERANEAEPNLTRLVAKYPQWPDPRIALSKLHIAQNQVPKALTELIEVTNNKDLGSKQAEQVALLLAQLGRVADGFAIFQKAAKAEPTSSFYAVYCKDWVDKNPGSYETVLAMVKSSLAENKNSENITRQLSLEIKHAALLLLLNRPGDAQAALEQSITHHPKNFDLTILLATAEAQLGQIDKAKAAFQTAAGYY